MSIGDGNYDNVSRKNPAVLRIYPGRIDVSLGMSRETMNQISQAAKLALP